MSNEENSALELFKNVYPELFAEIEKEQKYHEELMKLFYEFYKLITESAKISERRDWFIDTGTWINVMQYMLDNPDSWLQHSRKVLKRLNKKQK